MRSTRRRDHAGALWNCQAQGRQHKGERAEKSKLGVSFHRFPMASESADRANSLRNGDKKHQELREMFPKPLISWLRGLDLNQRPLGYEGKSGRHNNRDEPTAANDDEDLQHGDVVASWFVSVGLLHRNFIAGSDRPSDPLIKSRPQGTPTEVDDELNLEDFEN